MLPVLLLEPRVYRYDAHRRPVAVRDAPEHECEQTGQSLLSWLGWKRAPLGTSDPWVLCGNCCIALVIVLLLLGLLAVAAWLLSDSMPVLANSTSVSASTG
jgi:hypothetical protein